MGAGRGERVSHEPCGITHFFLGTCKLDKIYTESAGWESLVYFLGDEDRVGSGEQERHCSGVALLPCAP